MLRRTPFQKTSKAPQGTGFEHQGKESVFYGKSHILTNKDHLKKKLTALDPSP